MKETKENIEDNMVRQLPLKQFFKLIIYLLEDNETEENKKLFAPLIPIKFKIPLRYDIFIESLSFKCSAFIKLIIVCALAALGNLTVGTMEEGLKGDRCHTSCRKTRRRCLGKLQ